MRLDFSITESRPMQLRAWSQRLPGTPFERLLEAWVTTICVSSVINSRLRLSAARICRPLPSTFPGGRGVGLYGDASGRAGAVRGRQAAVHQQDDDRHHQDRADRTQAGERVDSAAARSGGEPEPAFGRWRHVRLVFSRGFVAAQRRSDGDLGKRP